MIFVAAPHRSIPEPVPDPGLVIAAYCDGDWRSRCVAKQVQSFDYELNIGALCRWYRDWTNAQALDACLAYD